jgi:hypothetical protein
MPEETVFRHSVTRRALWRRVFGLFFVLVSFLAFRPITEAAGPWRGQIVDSETGKPVEGVVVLAVWRKCGFIVMNGCAAYYDSEEVVTGPDGHFVIHPRRAFVIFPPLRSLKGPDFYIFKPGYGQWKFQGQESWSKDAIEREEQRKQAWRQFEGEGIVIELPQLKTREERLRFLSHPGGEIPKERIKRYLSALDQERMNLGLQPGYSK